MLGFILGVSISTIIACVYIYYLNGKLYHEHCESRDKLVKDLRNEFSKSSSNYDKFLESWWNEFLTNHQCNMCGHGQETATINSDTNISPGCGSQPTVDKKV